MSEENVQQGKELFSLKAGYKQYILTKTVKNINRPPWTINSEVIHAIQEKETARRKMKSFPRGAKNQFSTEEEIQGTS